MVTFEDVVLMYAVSVGIISESHCVELNIKHLYVNNLRLHYLATHALSCNATKAITQEQHAQPQIPLCTVKRVLWWYTSCVVISRSWTFCFITMLLFAIEDYVIFVWTVNSSTAANQTTWKQKTHIVACVKRKCQEIKHLFCFHSFCRDKVQAQLVNEQIFVYFVPLQMDYNMLNQVFLHLPPLLKLFFVMVSLFVGFLVSKITRQVYGWIFMNLLEGNKKRSNFWVFWVHCYCGTEVWISWLPRSLVLHSCR